MLLSTCRSCHRDLRKRLRLRISLLQSARHGHIATHALLAGLGLTPTTQSRYWDTTPPTGLSLAYATTFFRNHPPRKLWTATEWRNAKQASEGGLLIPEVAFLGRSNVGKSSLLNALLMAGPVNRVGPRPGKTTTMHCWGLSATDPKTGGALKGARPGKPDMKLAVLDMPGYGHASHGDWGQEVITYLKRRKQLRRVFVLLDAMHGVKEVDRKMLELLRQESISHEIIASKADRASSTVLDANLVDMKATVQPSGSGFRGLGEILITGSLGDGRSNSTMKARDMMGIEDVRYAVLAAVGLESRELTEAAPTIRVDDLGPTFTKIKESEERVESPFQQVVRKILEGNEKPKWAMQMEEEIQRLSDFRTSPRPPSKSTELGLGGRAQSPSRSLLMQRSRTPTATPSSSPPPTPQPERSRPAQKTSPPPQAEATKPKAAFTGTVGLGIDALMEMAGKNDKVAPKSIRQASGSGLGRPIMANGKTAGSRRRGGQRRDVLY